MSVRGGVEGEREEEGDGLDGVGIECGAEIGGGGEEGRGGELG